MEAETEDTVSIREWGVGEVLERPLGQELCRVPGEGHDGGIPGRLSLCREGAQ